MTTQPRRPLTPAVLVRALRLPFLTASVLPLIYGSLLADTPRAWGRLLLGVLAAAATHLSANLINDYADSRSGADWHDPRFFGLFGGSKLIQEGVLTERFYLVLALVWAGVAAAAILALAWLQHSLLLPLSGIGIVLLAWAYSVAPTQLAYRQLGELVIFLLFGPALVVGGYFIQTGRLFDPRPAVLSAPFGLLTAAILLANEIPDCADDARAGKRNLVSLVGVQHAYRLYAALNIVALLVLLLAVGAGYATWPALACLVLVVPVYQATHLMQRHYGSKDDLRRASARAILVQALAALILIAGSILWPAS